MGGTTSVFVVLKTNCEPRPVGRGQIPEYGDDTVVGVFPERDAAERSAELVADEEGGAYRYSTDMEPQEPLPAVLIYRSDVYRSTEEARQQ